MLEIDYIDFYRDTYYSVFMDNTAIPLDDTQKKSVQTTLATMLITALEQRKITVPEMQEIANYILDSFEKIQTNAQMMSFLEELKGKWPIFMSAYTIYKGEFGTDNKEEQIMNKLASYIQNPN